jgi:FkbM family methyltransferase
MMTTTEKNNKQSKYFLLSKSMNGEILDVDDDQIIFINQPKIMIIPREYISHHSQHGIYESSLMTWIAQEFSSKDKIFIDIGSHTGTFSVNLACKFKHVYSFEPQKMTYYALCGSIALSNIENVTCINVALGSKEQCKTGTAILNITSNDGGSSSLYKESEIPVLKEEVVQIRTLDSYIEIFKSDIGVIKMDVEKNELEVIKGGLKCLERSNYPMIFFEADKNHGEVFDFLKSLGYRVIPIQSYLNMYLAEIPK